MHAICESCCRADLLKSIFKRQSTKGDCSICQSKGCQVIETVDRDFVLAIKALIRYHYSEWDYHGKLGGDGFESLFLAENPIINLNPALDACEYEDFLLSFLTDIDRDQQITLFTAYGRDIYQHQAMRAISEGYSPLILKVTQELKRRNHFLVEGDYEERFRDIRDHVSTTVDPDSIWHRARIGATKRAACADYSLNKNTYYYEPYANETLAAPPVGTTSAGRLNRPGVSYLYLASDQDTAVAEIRPHPAELVSLGAFSINKAQQIADLSRHQLNELFRTDKELEILETIIAMENSFALAAPPSNRQIFSLTQFLAELLRRIGFSGVKFKSTVGQGINLVLFDPDDVTWVPNSSRVVEVQRVVYEHEDRKLYDPSAQYDIDFLAVEQSRTKKG